MISVVLPIFNENENIDVVAEAVSAELDRLARPYEVIFVDDGSTDGSFERLRQLAHLDSRIKVVRLSRNFGHQIAISAGLEFASGDAVIVMDADLQHPPELIPELVAQWEQGYDVVYTVREGRDHAGLLKRSSAAMFYWLMNRMCDIDIASNTPDFRLMNRRVVDVLLRFPERSRFLRGLVRWVGFRQKAVPFTARPRSHGRTKYPFARMLRFSVDGITAFSIVPLRLASYLGVLVALSGIPYASWAVYKRLFTDEAVHGWASLVVALLVIGGLLLVCIGILEFGSAYQTWQVVTNASREGARVAVLPDYSDDSVKARVRTYLKNGGLPASIVDDTTKTNVDITATTIPVDVGGTVTASAARVVVEYPFEFMVLQANMERVLLPFKRNLAELGIEMQLRRVDVSQFINRLRSRDFDMTSSIWPQSNSPGNEQMEFWHSRSADSPGSRNFIGLRDPAIDALVEGLIRADSRQSLITHARALDRALLWGHYVVPNYYIDTWRVAHWTHLKRPHRTPRYDVGLMSWWIEGSAPTPAPDEVAE